MRKGRTIKNYFKYILLGIFIPFLLSSPLQAGSFWNSFGIGDKGCGVIDDDAFEQYSCPKRSGFDSTLVGIDFVRAASSCRYGDISKKGSVEPVFNNCADINVVYFPNINRETFMPHSASVTKVETSLATSLKKFGKRMKLRDVLFSSPALNNLIKSDDAYYGEDGYFSKLQKKMKKFQGNDQAGTGERLSTFVKNLKIDSHTNYKETLAAAITATFTVDPDYFESGFVNNLGEANYKNKKLSLTQTDNVVDVVDWFSSLNPYAEGSLKNTTIMDFMDKQVLGFFINMVETLREVYNEMIFLFFIIGGVYSFGFYSYKKSLEKYGKEPFNINKLSFLSTTTIAFLFFSAPVINDGDIANNYVNELNSTTKAKIENWTSLGQETVRYVAQSSNYFANLSSDKLMSTYLNLIAKKSGFMNPSSYDLGMELDIFDGLQKQKKQLTAKVNFYENICRDYFNLDKDEFFNSSKNSAHMKTMTRTASMKGVFFTTGLADRLSFSLCSKIEEEIIPDTQDLVISTYDQTTRIERDLELLNTSSESIKRYENFLNLMAWGQSQFGWIFSASIPASYFFFDNAGLLIYDEVKIAGDKNIFKGQINNKSRDLSEDDNENISESIGGALEDGLISMGTSSMGSTAFYFLIPGFNQLFEFVDNSFHSFFIGSVAKAPSEEIKKSKVSSWLSGVKKLVGKIKKGNKNDPTSKLTDNASPYIGKMAVYFFRMLALFVSIVLFTYIISAVTIIMISALLVLKITLYYIELMLFFLSIQVMGLYYVVMGGGQGKDYLGHYSKSLAGLFMTPILIVLITGALIPAGKFFESFFSSIMMMIQAIINNGGNMMGGVKLHSDAELAEKASSYATGVAGRVDVFFHKSLLVIGIEGMTTIFSYFAILIISIILILNYKSWFMKMVGMEGGMDVMRENGSELRQGAAGKALNPVG